jgi:hypothetical protein
MATRLNLALVNRSEKLRREWKRAMQMRTV